MTYCILFLLGLVILWVGIRTADDDHGLAVASAAVIPLNWGYFSSPFLFQCLSGILILGNCGVYTSYS